MAVVIVTGGRTFTDREFVFSTLTRLEKESGRTFRGLIHGRAPGVDALAAEWQRQRIKKMEAYYALKRKTDPRNILRGKRNNNLWMLDFPAMWNDLTTQPLLIRYRKDGSPYNALAGHIRNQKMVDFGPELCVRFPGGSGTADCASRAHKAGIRVIEVSQ